MAMNAQPTGHSASTASAAWQSTRRGEQIAFLGNYLDQMTALPLLRQVAATSLELLRLAPGQRVLDVGCGNGVFLPLLAHAVGPDGTVEAVDHSPPFVAQATTRMADAGLSERVTVREADAYALPFADATFDAAHCERLLIHLDDPDAALREMRRVVRPGGVVVVAESYWRGLTIDAPDHEAMHRIIHHHTTTRTRQPYMGLELRRRFGAVGLTDGEIVPVIVGELTLPDIARYTGSGDFLTSAAAELVAAGQLTRERAEAVLAHVETASANGTFYGFGGIFVAAGRVPSP